jgi:hypothetical protein
MKHAGRSMEQLATLFRSGDDRIEDLIQALDDPDKEVRYNAQVIIRYLGNDKGMEALNKRCAKNADSCFGLPIPQPLRDWDYHFIRTNFLHKPPQLTPLIDHYLFALALDSSTGASSLLREVIENAKKHGIRRDESLYTQLSRGPNISANANNLVELVLKNASFLNARERQFATAKLIGYNGAKDKALVEIYVDGGPLAEEWYHIVVSRCNTGWKFFSISLVAVS